jgi:nondiscriminating aspartyl-tRNA synthetase
MKRIFISKTKNLIGKKVKIMGRVDSIRSHGKIVFFDLEDSTAKLQVVCGKNLFPKINEQSFLLVEGVVKKRPEHSINRELETGEIELEAEKIEVLALAKEQPFDLKNINLKLPKLLDFRPITLKSEKIKAIFKIEEAAVDGFRTTLKKLGFFEFQAPAIVPSSTEGGAEVFSVDYYGKKAFLAQSPQLYKQMLVPAFERVFTVCKAFRAEPSFTTRHLSEYTSLDVEMGPIEGFQELMDVCQKVIEGMIKTIENKCQKEIELLKVKMPKLPKKIPKLKLSEVQEIIQKRTKKDSKEKIDLDPSDEKEISQYAKENFSSDFLFVTHYPTETRPFYTFEDPEDPSFTLSFDLLFKGLEIVTGGQRISDYEKLYTKIKKRNLNPKNFKFYLQAFKYGMPPEGGFAIGLERFVKQFLELENVREASLFPRDPKRIDLFLK